MTQQRRKKPRQPHQDAAKDVERWHHLEQHAVPPCAQGDPASRAQLDALFTLAKNKYAHPPREVKALIELLLEQPEGVTHKKVRDRLHLPENRRATVLRADANFYAREQLICRRHRNAIPFYISFYLRWVDGSPLFSIKWRQGDKRGLRNPRPAPAVKLAPQPMPRSDRENDLAEAAGRVLAARQRKPSQHISKLLRRFVVDANTPWLEAHNPDPMLWSELVARAALEGDHASKGPSCTYIRCLPVVDWCEQQAREIARCLNESSSSEHAGFVSIAPSQSCAEAFASAVESLRSDPNRSISTVVVIFLRGHRRVESAREIAIMAKAGRNCLALGRTFWLPAA